MRFHVDEIRVLKVNYSLNPVKKSDGINDEETLELPVDLRCNSKFSEKEKKLRVILAAQVGGPESIFTIDVEVGGAFKFDKKPNKKTLEMLKKINCPAIVFPYLREFVSDLTMRGGHSPLYLPPINFVAASKHEDEKKLK